MAELSKSKFKNIISETAEIEKFPLLRLESSGSAAICGEAVLEAPGAACNVTVYTSAVKTESLIILTAADYISGRLWYDGISPNVSFRINSDDIGDAGKKVSWMLVNPA